MNIICKIFCPAQINWKLLKTIKSDLEAATAALARDSPDIINAQHYLRLASIVVNILLKTE